MAEQIKPDVPTLIKRIGEMCSLPKAEKETVHKFNREQLTELYVYISELRHSHKELSAKISEIGGNNG
jgi:hypothetical protein